MATMRPTTIALVLFCVHAPAQAQPWSNILNPTRAGNWAGNVGVPGGIPSGAWTQCGPTIVPYKGDASTINNALLACSGSNQYVSLGPGTFNLSSGISMGSLGNNVSNVALRGAGASATILQFANGINCVSGPENICMLNSTTLYTGSGNVLPPCGGTNSSDCANWTAGFAQGATSITITNVGADNITNGDVIVVDQGNDVAETGGYIVCDTISPLVCHQNTELGSGNGRVINGLEYSQEQWVTVTGGCSTPCSGDGPFTLTISPGLYANNWNNSGQVGVFFVKPTVNLGIESLTIDNSAGTARGNIAFYNCHACWVQNVRSIGGNRNHIWYLQSSRGEIRDSYFFSTRNGSTQSYGIELGEPGGSDLLIENNIFQQIAAPIVGGGVSGAVIGYNFSINNVYTPSTYMQGTYPSHDAADSFNLYEGNVFNGLTCDDIHGTPGGVNTYFRNWLNGLDWNQGTRPTQQTFPIDLDAFCRGFNIVGNVLGTPGYHQLYEAFPPNTYTQGQCNQTIYELGWGGGICSTLDAAGVADDTLVRATLMRWGNYDVVSGAVHWDPVESSPGAVPFIAAQSTPASHTLPSSFYLASKPPFWGVMPYPAIGPDVSGGTGPGGYAFMIPAQLCYWSVMNGPADGSGGVLGFEASSCYSNRTARPIPLPPGNLSAVAH